MKIRALLLLLSFSPAVQAQSVGDFFDRLFGPQPAYEINSRDMIKEFNSLARQGQRSLRNRAQWASASPKEAAACVRQFEDFYKDGVLDISMTFGYLDWPGLGMNLDHDSFEMVYESLTRYCSEGGGDACDFTERERIFPNKVVLEKRVANPGIQAPSNLRIRLTMTYSSWKEYDKDNFSGNQVRPEQLQSSQRAESAFFGSIGEAGHAGVRACDVCVYMGHARNGGGPDFRPVPMDWRLKDGEPDYAKYMRDRENFRRLMRAVSSSKHPTRQMVAIMGCNSEVKFYSTSSKACLVKGAPNCRPMNLRDFSAKTGFLVTSKLSWPQNQYQYMGILFDGVINMKCRSSWEESFKRLTGIEQYPEDYKLRGNFLQ